MRVIGGEARGRPLKAALPEGVRPTSDRAREAIFDVLASIDAIAGADVIDCFAGSGALGIEAISRGAASALFLDNDRAAVTATEANLARVGYTGRNGIRVVRSETLGFLATSRAHFDVALVDPPYRFAEWPLLLGRLRAGIAVLESDAEIKLPERFAHYRSYRHGGTLITVVTEVTTPNEFEGNTEGQGEGASA